MRLAAAALAALIGVGLVPASASGVPTTHQPSHNVTFGAGPAGPLTKNGKVVKTHGRTKYVVDGRSYFSYQAQPGSTTVDHIAILNFAHRPQRLAVYPVDATSATNGDFAYAPKAAPRRLAGAWLSVGTPGASGFVTVKARSRTILPIHLHVPLNAPPGDHGAAIIVSLTGLVTAKGRRVNFEQRVATRVLVRVSGTLRPQLSIEDLHAHYSGKSGPLAKGAATVSYVVANTGNALLGGTQHVSVSGSFGASASAPAMPNIPLLLPGARYPVRVRVPKVAPQLLETAKVTIAPAGLQGSVNPGVHLESASVHFWAIPWLLVLIILLVILFVAYRIIRRRRRQRSGALTTEAPQGATI